MKKLYALATMVVVSVFSLAGVTYAQSQPQTNPSDQGIGMQGRLQQPPPTDAPTISLPSNGQVFSEIPITVTGLCRDGLLVRVFKNNVFAGSAMCEGGSYTLQIDLFPGSNELFARQYDDLDQGGPESNKVTVVFDIPVPGVPGAVAQVGQRTTLTSNFARRGVDPNQELVWPITISGGQGPYAISVDWGDGKSDLMTQAAAGTFDIRHKYERPGVYRLIIKATGEDGTTAFLQLVVIVNGADIGTAAGSNEPTTVRTRVLWQPALITFPLLLSSFWLGKKYQLKRTRYRMKHRIVPIDK